jgi:hypothetical protein
MFKGSSAQSFGKNDWAYERASNRKMEKITHEETCVDVCHIGKGRSNLADDVNHA